VPTLDDLDPAGRRILVRADYNVPLAAGRVADDSRIRASLPTLRELLDRDASCVLMSHLGRPRTPDPALSLAPVARALAGLLGVPVRHSEQVVGEEVARAAASLTPGEVLLLENLRFHPGEKANEAAFAAELAGLGHAYVDDAFGTAHRAEASTVGVVAHLPAYAGRLLERELVVLGAAVRDPVRPFAVVLGGAKVSDKMGVLANLAPRADTLLVGGGMANTFLSAAGVPMGDSLLEPDRLADAAAIAEEALGRLHLPSDLVVAPDLTGPAEARVVSATPSAGVPAGWRALDIGPATRAEFAAALQGARTVVWNGPMGVFETPAFAEGTLAVARAIAALGGANRIAGGGDSVAALAAAGLTAALDWVSTGGGAMLALLAGEELPAVTALAERAGGGGQRR
jgi:phosphoglycerate kinase